MYKGSPTGGLTFRVGLRDVSGGAPVETVLFEHTMRMGDATVPVRVGPFGAVAPGSALFVEIEAVGSGIGEVGIFHRLAVGTPEELDRFTGWVTSSINVLRTEAAAVARPKMPPTNYRFVQPVFLDEPDDPYELSLTYVVDGRGVSDALSAAPRRPARVTNATAAGAERDLGIAEPRQGPHAMVYDFGGWPIPGGTESGGWAGGVQPGATVSTLPASFDIAGMGGDGEVGASWLGVVKVLVEDDPTKLLGDAAVAVRDAFVAALEAELEAVLPVAGTRTGLTLAEAKAVVAKVDSIAASVVSAAVLPKLGAQPAGDDLVGVVHEAFFVDELRDGGATRVDIITGASGSSYRVVIAAS